MTISNRILGGVGAGAVLLAALSFGAQAQEKQKINVLMANERTTSLYGAFVAQELGIYDDLGIEVNLLSSATTVPYVAFLANGDADLVMLDSAQVYQALNAQQPISVIYEVQQYASEAIIVESNSPIQSLTDLPGKTIGLASDRDQVTAVIALNSVDLSINDVSTVVVGESGPILAASLKNGQVDAFAGSQPDLAAVEANGVTFRNITPAAVSEVPGNSYVIWNDRKEELRDVVTKFLLGWSMGNHAGVIDTKAVAAMAKKNIPEQWENLAVGLKLLDTSVYKTGLVRTRLRGETQPDVWQRIQDPYIKIGEISGPIDPATFLDDSFIEGANAYKTADLKARLAKWKEANADILLP